MITITSYLHRDELSDMIRRWMYNNPRPSDSELIFRLVHFNNAYVYRYLHLFAAQILRSLQPQTLQSQNVFLKGDLKDMIVLNPPYTNPRVEEMLSAYRKFPERFYRETPFYGTLFFKNNNPFNQYVGSCRIKRSRRLAEKGARKIIDLIFETIKKRADELADNRALHLGLDRRHMITSPEEMNSEFLKAEARLIDDLRYHRPIQGIKELFINDVAGVKVIVEDSRQEHFLNFFSQTKNCEIVEKEVHSGKYNATNLIVCLRPPREQLLGRPLGGKIIRLMQARGLDAEQSHRDFCEFVESGEEEVYVEVIISSYQEMLESEIGRCMHEDRIIEQRLCLQYNSQLSRNIEYLMQYQFAFPASSLLDLGELPIKLWNRYLPDYFDEIIRRLFGIPSVEAPDLYT